MTSLTSHSAFSSDSITILVGSEEKKYTAHRDYLTRVPAFSACLEKGFKEGNENKIRLPEDDPVVVEMLLEYLYGGEVPLSSGWQEHSGFESDDDYLDAYLARAYLAADKYCFEDFQNACIDRLKKWISSSQKGEKVSPALVLMELSRAGLVECKMRQFVIQQLGYHLAQGYQAACDRDLHIGKLLEKGGLDVTEVMKAVINFGKMKNGGTQPARDPAKCLYHVHETSKCKMAEGEDSEGDE